MTGHLTIIICAPLVGALICLAVRESWTRPAALISSLGALLLTLWAFSLFGQDTTPTLGAVWEGQGGLVDEATLSAGIGEEAVRARFREALLSGVDHQDVDALAEDLAGVRIAEENLIAVQATPHDVERAKDAEAQLIAARRDASHLARSFRQLDRELRGLRAAAAGRQRDQFKFVEHSSWIPGLGVSYFLGVDGLSLALLALVSLLAFLAVVFASRPGARDVRRKCVVLLLAECGLLGVFCSLDVVLLFAFWVLLLLPGTFLVGGGSDSDGARVGARFFLPGFLGALALLLGFSLLALDTPDPTFNLLALTENAAAGGFDQDVQRLVFVCLFLGCAVRLPLVPIHGWLANAQEKVPAEFAALLHGGVLASGAYGLVRLAWPLCPDVASNPRVGIYVAVLALVNIGAGAGLVLAERDLRRVLAHVSVASAGVVLLGLAGLTPSSLSGASLEVVANAAACAGACLVVGAIVERTHDSDLHLLGGLSKPVPYLSGLGVMLLLSLVGLPGLAGFSSRLLVFMGAWQSDLPAGMVIAALVGIGLTSAGLLWVLARAFLGSLHRSEHSRLPDLRPWEALAIVPIAATCLLLGLLPRAALDALDPALEALFALIKAP